MALVLSAEIPVEIDVGGETVKAIFPSYDSEGFNAEIKRLCSERQKGKGLNIKDVSFSCRVRFFNATCLRVEGVETVPGTPLTAETENWRRLIPDNWKVSWALYFEEKNALSEEDVGN